MRDIIVKIIVRGKIKEKQRKNNNYNSDIIVILYA